ncbi:MAG TPA: hypothetical protein VM367_02505 [Pseudonocardia sp.]|jgi:hypothetical protein|nr:hypothetical protein [Pseudonocardia sp.]
MIASNSIRSRSESAQTTSAKVAVDAAPGAVSSAATWTADVTGLGAVVRRDADPDAW